MVVQIYDVNYMYFLDFSFIFKLHTVSLIIHFTYFSFKSKHISLLLPKCRAVITNMGLLYKTIVKVETEIFIILDRGLLFFMIGRVHI